MRKRLQLLERPAIRVDQPVGTFYVFSLHAALLNRITYSQPAEVVARMEQESDDHRGGYSIFGTQRGESSKRLDEIAAFIQTAEATFPNAIILAANYDEEGRYEQNEARQWAAKKGADGCWKLRIPSWDFKSASIIDGQHRLHAFERVPENAPNRDMELVCVVFLELPTPYHAYVFATINFNQKKVDRSLAYELFGFDVDERPASTWSPETLAVYLARLLNTSKESPLYRCIFPAADSEELFDANEELKGPVQVSMATIVDGILRLISRNPKDDRYIVRRLDNRRKGRRSLSSIEGLPLRDFYLEENDRGIYELLVNYFRAVQKTVWAGAGEGSYLFKTIGVQALFDVLRVMLRDNAPTARNYSAAKLTETLQPASRLDRKGDKYQASGIGRSEIRADLLHALGLAE